MCRRFRGESLSSARPSVMLSATERMSESAGAWWITLMPARSMSRGLPRSGTDRPSTSIVPRWGRSAPVATFTSVDFPAPLWPRSPTISPRVNFKGYIGKRHIAAEGDVHVGHAEERRPRCRLRCGGDGSAGGLLHGTAARCPALRVESRSVPHIADVEVLRGLRRDEFRIDEDVR